MFRLTARLGLSQSGVAAVEFGLTAPFLLAAACGGMELANYAHSHMQMSQISASLADNAGRMAMSSDLSEQDVLERDVNEVLAAAVQEGRSFDLGENGRLILSSLQANDDGGQWIAWQRCTGSMDESSRFGPEGTGESGTDFAGVEIRGQTLQAAPGTAVMVAEIYYRYEPFLPFTLFEQDTVYYAAAFPIRDRRTLDGLKNPAPSVAPSLCE